MTIYISPITGHPVKQRYPRAVKYYRGADVDVVLSAIMDASKASKDIDAKGMTEGSVKAMQDAVSRALRASYKVMTKGGAQ